jgi:hypothetical protein
VQVEADVAGAFASAGFRAPEAFVATASQGAGRDRFGG